jgi:hypothetical protein
MLAVEFFYCLGVSSLQQRHNPLNEDETMPKETTPPGVVSFAGAG